jgi:hypothetical protein
MSRSSLTFDTARKLALALPGMEEGTTYGTRALKVRGTFMACVPSHKSAEPGSLVVRVDVNRRADLLEEAPETYYLPHHYVNYPFVLVRLSRLTRDALQDLLKTAWRLAAARPSRARGAARTGPRN